MRNKFGRAAAAVLSVVLLLGAGGRSGGFAQATAPYSFSFPRDHFAHDAYRTEWWYFTGHLHTAAGRRFGYELTFFRIGLEPHPPRIEPGQSAWRTTQLYPAHFAISDERAGSFVHAQTLARGALHQGYASETALDVGANGWFLRANAATEPVMHLSARSGDDAVALTVVPEKPPAVHGQGGISRKSACASCASHYYSFTRLATSGFVTRSGVRYPVNGISWMDHEYGSDELSPQQTGWDWFSIQLDDGREVMLYRLRERDGSTTPQSSGSLVEPDGTVRHLPLRSFTISAISTWVSPHTHASYPSGWKIAVAGLASPLLLVPILDDQELFDPDGTTYWEGAVDVEDAKTRRRIGAGYVELTGYASPVVL